MSDIASYYRVLKEIERVCPPDNENRMYAIRVDGLSDAQVSSYCHILTELGFIESGTIPDKDLGSFFMPLRLTVKGAEYLAEINKPFWDQAEAIALETFKGWTKVDLSSMVAFFHTVLAKYQREKVANV